MIGGKIRTLFINRIQKQSIIISTRMFDTLIVAASVEWENRIKWCKRESIIYSKHKSKCPVSF